MMEILLASLAFIASLLLAGVMGFAIQRGATCTVAAVGEMVEKRRGRRLLAMIEASVWVAGGLVIVHSLHLLGRMPAGYPVNALTVLGGVLLGLGAFINGACVFGAIARLGSGEWAYAVTPLGFYTGCLLLNGALPPAMLRQLAHGSLVLQAPPWLALAFIVFMLWRLGRPLVAAWRQGSLRVTLAQRAWAPHAATTVIGIAFFFMLMLVGAWAYTDVLMDLARSMMAGSLLARCLLLVALLLGAILGGWTAGKLGSSRVSVTKLATCFLGGMLMGAGSLLIPGGNDGLILVGMPLLWPYAWVAFATMCISIAAAMLVWNAIAHPVAGQEA
jgi:toxin CptA